MAREIEIKRDSNSIISSRIEPVSDPEVNRALFTIYENLVEPFEEIEGLQQEIEDKKAKIQENKDEMGFITTIMESGYIGIRIAPIIDIIISVLYLHFTNQFGKSSWESWWMFFGAMLLFAIPAIIAGFVLCLIGLILRNIKLKADNAELEKEISEIESIIPTKIEAISDVVCFVPPNYRNSTAMKSFVLSYGNSKADNLKEAVMICDTEEYRISMLQAQQDMMIKLDSIAFDQMMLGNQLDGIRRDVWLSDMFF